MLTFFLKHPKATLSLLIIAGVIFRVYNLNWGAPWYFHPDERNIASAIAGLKFPSQMNPHFFAYGSLPIYLVFFANLLFNFLTQCRPSYVSCDQVSFEHAIIGLRIIAAICSILMIPLGYLIGSKLRDSNTGLIAAFLMSTSVGFIQFAHFGTYEMWLTLFTMLMFSTTLWFYESKNTLAFLLMTITTAILVSSKVTSIILLIIPIFVILKIRCKEVVTFNRGHHKILHLGFSFFQVSLFLLILVYVYILTNPYTYLDKLSFLSTMQYESSVALGSEPVFYTGEFYNTQPIIFQFLHVFPFLINPILTFIIIPATIYACFKIIRSKLSRRPTTPTGLLLLVIFFIVTLVSQAFFFVKWTRYMLPTIPFIYLLISILAIDLLGFAKKTKQDMHKHVAQSYVIFSIYFVVVACSFFITDYLAPDTRIAGADLAGRFFTSNTPLLSEVYDMGITPFNPRFSNIRLFNFYDLDNPYAVDFNYKTLQNALSPIQGIIIPSQRILKSRLINPKKFPVAYSFYKKLFSNQLPYHLVYSTPCDIFCRIAYMGDPVFSFEETADVFDRPSVYIFKKI